MKIGVFATGGTISMAGSSPGIAVTPVHGAEALVGAASLGDAIEIERFDLFSKPSASMTLADAQAIADRLCNAFDSGLDGAVVTHGTDTLEETAFALSIMLGRTQPVVITGAMRSADDIASDGPANLSAALHLAASPAIDGQRPVVLFGDEIHAAHLVRKVHSSRRHAFSSEPFGLIGQIIEGQVRIELRALLEIRQLRLGERVPVVPILQVGLDLEPETLETFDNAAIDGLIVAGVGGGHIASRAVDAFERLARKIPVVLTSRVGMGETLRQSYGYQGSELDLVGRGAVNGGRWRPAQARILLQLLLSSHEWKGSLSDEALLEA